MRQASRNGRRHHTVVAQRQPPSMRKSPGGKHLPACNCASRGSLLSLPSRIQYGVGEGS